MSRHNIYRQAVMTTGEPYTPRPADFGLCGRITCSRCGRLMPVSATKFDTHPLFRGKQQRRCTDLQDCKDSRPSAANKDTP